MISLDNTYNEEDLKDFDERVKRLMNSVDVRTISSSVILGLDPGVSSKEKQLEITYDVNNLKSNDSKEISISSCEFIDPRVKHEDDNITSSSE